MTIGRHNGSFVWIYVSMSSNLAINKLFAQGNSKKKSIVFNLFIKSHRSKSWVLLLETWVFIHGTLTALIQPGIGWQIFSYGFMAIFLVNQIFQLKISQSKLFITILYSLYTLTMWLGLKKDKAYYRATFIPISEYICVYIALTIGNITKYLVKKVQPLALKSFIVVFAYLFVSAGLTVGLALVLAGNLRVYDDY